MSGRGDDAFWRTEEERNRDEESYLRAGGCLFGTQQNFPGVGQPDPCELRVNYVPPKKAVEQECVKFDSGKRRVDLVPTEAINALADILTAGAEKYGEHNWRHGMDWSRVYGAAQRHLLAFWGGDDIDEESGMPHLWHALTNIAFLVAYQAMSVGRDDRWKQEPNE